MGMSWCSLSSAVRWTHGHAVLIRFAAAAICPSSMINPGCYLAPPGRAVSIVFACVCMVFHAAFLHRLSFKHLLKHQKCYLLKYYRYFLFVCFLVFLFGTYSEFFFFFKVIFGPSDDLPQCLGHTWGYVRHCNRGTGTMDLHFEKKLIPASICHLMLNRK